MATEKPDIKKTGSSSGSNYVCKLKVRQFETQFQDIRSVMSDVM